MPVISSGVVKGRRCPICGAEHTSCGLPYQGQPVDIPEVTTVADTRDLAIYQDAEGHTFQMSSADAKEAGYTRVGSDPEPVPSSAADSEAKAQAADESEEKAQAPAANKARQPAGNK